MNIAAPDLKEIVELGAVDNRFFCLSWFPKTFRDPPPPFENDVWDVLDASSARMANIQMFRGSAKTTRLRAFVAKRIAYGISRVILYIGANEGKALQSVGWVKRVIENNKAFCDAYGLVIGEKWRDDMLQIKHKLRGHDIWVLGMGILGSTRGINLDDYRPDLIIVDDAYDEDTVVTDEQRTKIEDRILGALANSLAPETENPDAKLAMLQTPFHPLDASMKALTDPEWTSIRQGCWTKATERMPIDYQESSWEFRFPTPLLRRKKLGHIARNKKSLFAREMECLLTTSETADFKAGWLRYYNLSDIPYERMWKVMAIDPVPKPTAAQLAKGLIDKDYEVLAVVGYHMGNYYLLDYKMSRGHDPGWSVTTFFEMRQKWRPKKVRVEGVAYQSTLSWLLQQAMISQRQYTVIEEVTDRRSKRSRIVDALSGPASLGKLYVLPQHGEFISQFTDYPAVAHDDVLDCISMAVDGLQEAEHSEEAEDDDEFSGKLTRSGGCP